MNEGMSSAPGVYEVNGLRFHGFTAEEAADAASGLVVEAPESAAKSVGRPLPGFPKGVVVYGEVRTALGAMEITQ